MKRLALSTTLAVAAASMLIACGTDSGSGGSSTVLSSSPTSTAASTASTSAVSTGASTVASSTAGTAVTSGGLDAASVAWFDVLCTNMLIPFDAIDKADAALGTMGAGPNNPAQGQANAAAALAALEKTSASLAGTAPPGFDGGEAYATAVTSQLTTVITAMTAGQAEASAALATLNTSDPVAVEKYTSEAARQGMVLISPLFTAVGQLDPAVQAAANRIPSCSAGGGIPLATPSVAPAQLDPASVTWFDTLCTTLMGPLGDIAESEKSAAAGTSTVNPSQSESRALQVLTRTADALASTPPPGFEGGAAYASGVTAALRSQVQAGRASSMAVVMSAIGRLEPAIRAAADQIPSCQGQLPGG